jgi:hypothetical protein
LVNIVSEYLLEQFRIYRQGQPTNRALLAGECVKWGKRWTDSPSPLASQPAWRRAA